MNIPFRKLTPEPKSFSVQLEEEGTRAVFAGEIRRLSGRMARIEARLTGEMERSCDVCAETYTSRLDEPVVLLVHEGIYRPDEETGYDDELDIVETENDAVELEGIARGELEAIRCEYHKCENCESRSESWQYLSEEYPTQEPPNGGPTTK